MVDAGKQPEVMVWCDGQRAGLVQRVLGRLADPGVAAIGGPRRGQLADIADALGVKLHDDLRKMLVDHPGQHLLLATGEGVGAAELKQARESAATVAALEPLAPETAEAEALGPGAGGAGSAGGVAILPSLRATPAWLSAAEPLQALGKLRSVQVASLGPQPAGTLHARLHEAVEMLLHLLGTPLTVDAALTGGPSEPPENLAALTGDLTAHLRFGHGAAAVLHASDRSATWSRRIVVLGEEAQLTLDDVSYSLLSATGQVLDTLKAPVQAADPADLIARQWRRLIEAGLPPEWGALKPVDPKAISSCCRAALLSCRTSQIESPSTLLRMGRV